MEEKATKGYLGQRYSSCIKALLSYEMLDGEKGSCKNQSPSDFTGLYTFL